MNAERRLLILSCSKKKRSGNVLMAAVERYDGPLFRVLRRFLRECPHEARLLDIVVVSAEFGLISANINIPFYDRRISAKRAEQLNEQVLIEFKRQLKRRYYEIFLCVGREYMKAMNGYEELIPFGIRITRSAGGQGRKQSMLYDWLWGKPPTRSYIHAETDVQKHIRIRGVEIRLSPSEVLEMARCVLNEDRSKGSHYVSWYIDLDGKRIAPKWLVSKMTGLPVSAFATDEARRVLTKLGIEVVRA